MIILDRDCFDVFSIFKLAYNPKRQWLKDKLYIGYLDCNDQDRIIGKFFRIL